MIDVITPLLATFSNTVQNEFAILLPISLGLLVSLSVVKWAISIFRDLAFQRDINSGAIWLDNPNKLQLWLRKNIGVSW